MTFDQNCMQLSSMTIRVTEDLDNYKGHCINFKHNFFFPRHCGLLRSQLYIHY